ncbi:MAG: helix-turn-helix transcriptional regulator [Spirochaetaceae bacterium]|nr:helix-turn-helix transcriptional regulator [Spirochaetaceae bacterium]
MGGTKNRRENPAAVAVHLINSKWKILILQSLRTGTRRFGELRKTLPGISQKVLTGSLRSLEEDGIVKRTVYAEVPPRVEYSLTELGKTLLPVIHVMEEWGKTYLAAIGLEPMTERI